MRKTILLFAATFCMLGTLNAQYHCFTDEVTQRAKEQYSQIALDEARLKTEIENQLLNMGLRSMAKTTDINDTATLYVPIVFHIVHDYSVASYITDNDVYASLRNINNLFNKENPDTADVINVFKGKIPGTNVPYIGNAKIRFRLATKDPLGQPTHGITRRHSHLSTFASDQAKFDGWPQHAYLNIWLIRRFNQDHSGAGAYAYKPPTAAAIPHVDGVICLVGQRDQDHTLSHEIGHSLNLDHTWGGTNSPMVACGDDDVDDTPPTKGHTGGCTVGNLYDTECLYNTGKMGIINMDFADFTAGTNNDGISFHSNISGAYIDSVSFYPTDSGKPYQIVLKYNGNTIDSHTGITTDNKTLLNAGKLNINNAATIADSATGVGLKFRIYDSILINSVRFYSTGAGQPYEIVLKRGGTTLHSYTGVTGPSGIEVSPLRFKVVTVDTTVEFSLEFAVNPGARRDTSALLPGAAYVPTLPGIFTITAPSTNGRYNYFHNWSIGAFRYKEKVNVNFMVPTLDTNQGAFSLEFSNNPGAKREYVTGTTIYFDEVPDVFKIDNHINNPNYYNYFYDITVRYGYYKRYGSAMALALFGDSTKTFINYPDTVNAQNVMDYTFCAKMFTHLQAVRMRTSLQNNIANRSNLITAANHAATGILEPFPDLPPIADFTIENMTFICPTGPNIIFRNRSWNDTISNLEWTFVNGSETKTATNVNPNYTSGTSQKFNHPGWVNISLKATSNAGTHTVTKNNLLYIADTNTISAQNYIQEFNPGSDLDKYPTFNYFNNPQKWEFVNFTGFYDNTSIRYSGYDSRFGTETRLNSPEGDYDDFFTPAFDLSSFSGSQYCNLSFMSSGAFVTNTIADMTDSLEISYSTNCGVSWVRLKALTKQEIGNNGTQLYPFAPSYHAQWQLQSINLPQNIRQSRVFFRFRFKPNIGRSPLAIPNFGTGNNFYIDRLHFNDFPTGINPDEMEKKNMVLAPNPTTGSTFVVLNNITGKTTVQVTDITGKLIFRTETTLHEKISRIEIPASYISVSGVYLVQVLSDNGTKQTEKLVVH